MRFVAIAATVVGVLALLVFVVPTYVGRYLLSQYVQSIGASAEGIDTLDVDLLTAEARIGPLQVWAGDAQHAQLDHLAFDLGLGAFLEGNILFRDMMISGVTLRVTQGRNGQLAVNGIDLDRITSFEANIRQQPEVEVSALGLSWPLGFGNLDLRDATLTVEPADGETVTVEVNRLRVHDVKSWQTDSPGDLSLAMEVEGADVDASGHIRLLPGGIVANVDSSVVSPRVSGLARLLPLGRDTDVHGAAKLQLQQDIVVASSGAVRVGTSGSLHLEDIEVTGGPTAEFAEASVEIGKLLVATGGEIAAMDVGSNLRLDSGVKSANKTAAEAEGEAVLHSARLASAGTRLQTKKATLTLREFVAGLGDSDLRIQGRPRLTFTDPDLSGTVQASAQRFGLDLSQLVVAGESGASRLSARGSLQLEAARTPEVRARAVELELRDLRAQPGDGGLIIAGAPRLVARQPVLTGTNGARADSLSLDLSAISVSTETTTTDVTAKGTARIDQARYPASGTQVEAGTVTANLRQTDLALAEGGGVRFHGKPQLTLRDVRVSGENKGAADRLDFAFSTLRANSVGAATSLEAAGNAAASSARLTLPKTAEQPAMSASLENLETSFDGLRAQLGGDAPDWQGDLDIHISGLNARVAQGDAARAEVGTIEVENVQAGDGGGDGAGTATEIAAQDVKLADIDMIISRKLVEVFGGQQEQTQEAVSNVRVGRLRTVGDVQIRFRDRMIDPTVQSSMAVDKLRVQDLDTAKPDQKARFQLIAVLNEFTNIRASGRASPFADQPEFNIDARVKGFEMPEVSPYARKYAGVRVESGQLAAEADAAADDGTLDASIDMTLRHLQVEKAGEGLLSGVPVKMGLALLEGPNGKITVTLPVSGSLSDPEFDVSEIVSQAIGGAVRSAIGTTAKLLFPPAGIASLLADDQSGEVQDVPFDPGSADLTGQGQTMVEGYAELLSRRPKLSLQVCGRATGADFDAHAASSVTVSGGDEAGSGSGQPGAPSRQHDGPATEARPDPKDATPALRELAQQRTHAVRRYLVEEAGLSAERVSECRPQWNAQDGGEPRAEVSL